jgi:ubiquinone/menaquinone biosynthesis C-methylase UbiE
MMSPIPYLRIRHHYGRYAIVKEIIAGKGRRLLDVGCGSPARCIPPGAFLDYVGYGEGIDIEPLKVKFKFQVGSITNTPFGDEEFEVVTAIEVIEHIADPLPALQEVHRVLKPKGTFVMTTPDNTRLFNIFWWFWERTFGREWRSAHLTTYRKREWERVIREDNHFEIRKVIAYWGINAIFVMEKNSTFPNR